MADRPRNILVCSCEDTMPLDADAVRRGCRGANVSTARQLCRAELERFRAGGGERRAAHRRLHAGSAAVLRSRRRRQPTSTSSTSARPPAGRRTPTRPAPRWRRCSRPRAEPLPEIPFVSFDSEGVILVYGRDEQRDRGRQPAQGPSRRHGADHAARRRRRRRASPISRWCKGTHPLRQGPSRRLRARRSTTMRSRRRRRAAR